MKRNFHDELNIFVLILKEGILSNYVTAPRLNYLFLFARFVLPLAHVY